MYILLVLEAGVLNALLKDPYENWFWWLFLVPSRVYAPFLSMLQWQRRPEICGSSLKEYYFLLSKRTELLASVETILSQTEKLLCWIVQSPDQGTTLRESWFTLSHAKRMGRIINPLVWKCAIPISLACLLGPCNHEAGLSLHAFLIYSEKDTFSFSFILLFPLSDICQGLGMCSYPSEISQSLSMKLSLPSPVHRVA